MGTDISKGEIGVAQSTFKNAPKVMFFPQTQNATFSRPRTPHSMLESKTLERASAPRINPHHCVGGPGGDTPPLLHVIFFDAKSASFLLDFFAIVL